MSAGLLLGIDYGGTATKLVASSPELDTNRGLTWTFPTPRGASALDQLAESIGSCIAGLPVLASGVTIAGILDDATGVVTRSTNLPWLDGIAVGDVLGEILGLPVVAVHDGRAAARAEAMLGAGRGSDDTFVVTLGTGIAGAHFVGGSVRSGAHGAAGEIGHVIAHPDGRSCGCGQRGCLETVMGGRALAAEWSELIGYTASAHDLIDAARLGDTRAMSVVENATDALGRALLGVIATVDPGMIVIGGGLSQAKDLILDPTIAKVRAGATFHTVPAIRNAALGPWAGGWGAVIAAGEVAKSTTVAVIR